MPNVSLARSKSPADLARFRDLMDAARRALKSNSTSASTYYQAAMALVSSKRIYFVEA